MPPRSSLGRSPVSVTRWSENVDAIEESSSSEAIQTSNRKETTLQTTSIMSAGGMSKKKKNSTNARRSVSFAAEDQVHPIVHLTDMTAKEIASIWYDQKEYAEIKSSYQATIFVMENAEANGGISSKLETEEHVFRGLEYRTQTGAWARYENKRDAYNAVLDEQDRQWKNDKDDYDALSRVYIEHSAKCVKAAYLRGIEDQEIAVEICSSFYKGLRKTRSGSSEASKKSSGSKKKSTDKVKKVRSVAT